MKVYLFYNLIFIFLSDDELIENMLPEDVWFHVDSLSSAHVYLRLKEVLFIVKFMMLLINFE